MAGRAPTQRRDAPDLRQNAIAGDAESASLRRVHSARESFLGWTNCLLDPARPPTEQLTAAHAWCAWVLGRLGMDAVRIDPPDAAGTCPTALSSGEAISPQRAVLCLREHLRTAVYLRALADAVRMARERFPGEVIHLVEAGCGPAAPMALAMAARFAPTELQVTLLDIHASSLRDARHLAGELGLERSIRGAICGDAVAVRFAEADRPHLVVAEVLRRALKKEPQVAVTRALAPQVRAGGFFLPERIEVGPGLVHGSGTLASPRQVEWLGAAFSLEAATAGALAPDATGRLPPRVIEVPPHSAAALQLLTRMQVWREHTLGDFDCSLTAPERLRGVPEAVAERGGRLVFAYEISADPGLRLVGAEPVALAGC